MIFKSVQRPPVITKQHFSLCCLIMGFKKLIEIAVKPAKTIHKIDQNQCQCIIHVCFLLQYV